MKKEIYSQSGNGILSMELERAGFIVKSTDLINRGYGIIKNVSSSVCYAWFVWMKGYGGLPEIDWIK
jgi:hypothetical protein